MTRTRLSTRAVSTLPVKIPSACAAMLLSACANMSGLGGSADYGCKAPQGVQCNSVSGNYYNAIANNLPSQRQHGPNGAGGDGSASALAPVSSASVAAPIAGKAGAALPLPLPLPMPIQLAASPLRSQARLLRLWFKPWEDADHDLYDQGYVYVQIDSGRWLIDHAQQRIRDAYAPVRPPQPRLPPKPPSSAVTAAPAASSATASPRLPGAGAADVNASPSVSKPFPGAADLPADDSQ